MSTNAHLSDCVKTVRVMSAQAAGSSAVNGTGVDMTGYDAVRFVALFGTLAASQVTSLKAQQSTDNSTFSDIENSQTAAMDDADDNDMLITDLIRPATRYVRPVVNRATANAVIDGVVAELYRARDVPITADATAIDTVKIVHPVAGTA